MKALPYLAVIGLVIWFILPVAIVICGVVLVAAVLLYEPVKQRLTKNTYEDDRDLFI